MSLSAAIVGHFVGDFLLQNDWMANNKKNANPGVFTEKISHKLSPEYKPAARKYWLGNLSCLLHCLLWTLTVLLFTGWWSWPVAAWLFLTHYAIDRTQFIRWWMGVVGQKGFRDNLSPWSCIWVDQTFHLLTLYLAAIYVGS